MRVIKTTVYNFDELSDEAKERAIEDHRTFLASFPWDIDYITDYWVEELSKIGFENAEIFYDGQTVSFKAVCDTEKLLNTLIYCETRKTPRFGVSKSWQLLRLDKIDELHGISIDLRNTPGSIVYCSAISDLGHESQKILEDLASLEDSIDYLYRQLCEQIRIEIEKDYEYQLSDENVIESIRCNEYEFTEDGKLI